MKWTFNGPAEHPSFPCLSAGKERGGQYLAVCAVEARLVWLLEELGGKTKQRWEVKGTSGLTIAQDSGQTGRASKGLRCCSVL